MIDYDYVLWYVLLKQTDRDDGIPSGTICPIVLVDPFFWLFGVMMETWS